MKRERGVKRPRYEGQQFFLDSRNGMKPVRTDNRGPPSKVRDVFSPTRLCLSDIPILSTTPSKPAQIEARVPATSSSRGERVRVKSKHDEKGKRPPPIPREYCHPTADSVESSTTTEVAATRHHRDDISPTRNDLVSDVWKACNGMVNAEIQASMGPEIQGLTDRHWEGLDALHRTLLHGGHDSLTFKLPEEGSENLRSVALLHKTQPRAWRCTVRTVMQHLIHQLPNSMNQTLAFIDVAYKTTTLLSTVCIKDTGGEEEWAMCLRDLARYQRAVEDACDEDEDRRSNSIWYNVVRKWYKEADLKRSFFGQPRSNNIKDHIRMLTKSCDVVEWVRAFVSGYHPGIDGLCRNTHCDASCSNSSRGGQFDSLGESQKSLLFRNLTQVALTERGDHSNGLNTTFPAHLTSAAQKTARCGSIAIGMAHKV